jgi:hypothetical protein
MDSARKSLDAGSSLNLKRDIGCNHVFVLLMSGHSGVGNSGHHESRRRGANQKEGLARGAMDTIDFAAPAADPLDHECNRIKCSLR